MCLISCTWSGPRCVLVTVWGQCTKPTCKVRLQSGCPPLPCKPARRDVVRDPVFRSDAIRAALTPTAVCPECRRETPGLQSSASRRGYCTTPAVQQGEKRSARSWPPASQSPAYPLGMVSPPLQLRRGKRLTTCETTTPSGEGTNPVTQVGTRYSTSSYGVQAQAGWDKTQVNEHPWSSQWRPALTRPSWEPSPWPKKQVREASHLRRCAQQ